MPATTRAGLDLAPTGQLSRGTCGNRGEVVPPELPRVGPAAGDRAYVEDKTLDAIRDHDEIRDAVAAVGREQMGTPEWFKAAVANKTNRDHMAQEERQGLTDFHRGAAPAPPQHAPF